MPVSHGGGLRLVRINPGLGDFHKERGATFQAYGLDGPLVGRDASNNEVPLTVGLKAGRVTRGDQEQLALVPVFPPGVFDALRDSYLPALLHADTSDRMFEELVFYDRLVKPPSDTFKSGDLAVQLAAIKEGGLPESGVADSHPAAYTYFGQFIAHDLTNMIWDETVKPVDNPIGPMGAWVNKASGHGLDFDSLIGVLPDIASASGWTEVRGNWLGASSNLVKARDLPRDGKGMPATTDKRADANLAVAQMHVMLSRFYRYVCSQGFDNDAWRVTVQHLQAVVLFDYLRRIICEDVYCDVMQYGRRVVAREPLSTGNVPFFIPIEFAAACFRFGHSMVREQYHNWSAQKPTAELVNILHYVHAGGNSPLSYGRMPRSWLHDWDGLLDSGSDPQPTMAEAIDLRLTTGMCTLPPRLFEAKPGEAMTGPVNLAERTLSRGIGLGLASAQEMQSYMTGQGVHVDLLQDIATSRGEPPPAGLSKTLIEKTPLWLYTLWEAQAGGGAQLGPLAGRIVMETLHAAIENSAISIIKRDAQGKACVQFDKSVGNLVASPDAMTLRKVRDAAFSF